MTFKSVLQVTFGVALTLVCASTESLAHEVLGVQSYYSCQPTVARAFLRSPNPGTGNRDYPLVVIDANGDPTGEYIVVITLQNQSDFDARMTAVGFAWAEASGFELVQLNRAYNELTTNVSGTRTGTIGPHDYAVAPSFTISQSQGNVEFSIREDIRGVPGFPHTALSFALVTGNTFSGGKPDDGLATDVIRHQIAIKGVLPIATGLSQIEELLNAAYVRFRQVGWNGEGSDTGIWRNLLPPVSCP